MLTSSDNKKLGIPEIMLRALQNQGLEQRMIAPSIAGLVQEGAMPDTDVRQYGNTVFITHFKTKDGMKVAYGRALNADKAKNYLKNGEEYFRYLLDENVNYFISLYEDPKLSSVFKYIQRPEVQARVGGTAEVEMKEAHGMYGVTIKLEAA